MTTTIDPLKMSDDLMQPNTIHSKEALTAQCALSPEKLGRYRCTHSQCCIQDVKKDDNYRHRHHCVSKFLFPTLSILMQKNTSGYPIPYTANIMALLPDCCHNSEKNNFVQDVYAYSMEHNLQDFSSMCNQTLDYSVDQMTQCCRDRSKNAFDVQEDKTMILQREIRIMISL
uniref:Uncharacterized protein n=1 Tax=Cucumis melo TaxID=3656 RepID=A0A9I9E966_CUCME